MEDCYQIKNWKKQYVRQYRMMHQMQQGLKKWCPNNFWNDLVIQTQIL